MWLAKEDVGYIQNFGGENHLEDREGDGKKNVKNARWIEQAWDNVQWRDLLLVLLKLMVLLRQSSWLVRVP